MLQQCFCAYDSNCTKIRFALMWNPFTRSSNDSALVMTAAPSAHVNKYVLIWSLLSGFILGLRLTNERRRYFVTLSLIGWVQTFNQPCYYRSKNNIDFIRFWRTSMKKILKRFPEIRWLTAPGQLAKWFLKACKFTDDIEGSDSYILCYVLEDRSVSLMLGLSVIYHASYTTG